MEKFGQHNIFIHFQSTISHFLILYIYDLPTGHADQHEKSNFLKEIEMMKKVSGSEDELSKFVVNMVGCVTSKEPMMLVLEYMKYGNLLEYLRHEHLEKASIWIFFN